MIETLSTEQDYLPGCRVEEGITFFRYFCPRAKKVFLHVFQAYESEGARIWEMKPEENGWWKLEVDEDLTGFWYGYRLIGQKHDQAGSIAQLLTNHVIADPFSTFVTCRNHYKQYPKSYIARPNTFQWTDQYFQTPADPRDLIIYETHLKDLTAHDSSGCKAPGTYLGLVEPEQKGGLEYLKKLGVNAVEFLPLQKFSYFEPPYMEATLGGGVNTWNYYGRNYWGYMTSFFMAPETTFASDGSTEVGAVIGRSEAAGDEFKHLVNSLHNQGISVIMDVVYNHVSQYDLNPLKYTDIHYYFRKNKEGYLTSDSGCGNDFKTEAPESRRLIIESLKHWASEYHIDGFRFDLAGILDWETVEQIREELKQLNPNIVLIAEPWGRRYDPQGFSHRDWASWNDQIRNGIKGHDPANQRGFIFGQWQPGINKEALENHLCGTLLNKHGGRFMSPKHAVNYVESHDGYTLGDFVRLVNRPELFSLPVKNMEEHLPLNETELKQTKLAALFLFVSQGITMIHCGQEFARSKVVAPNNFGDPMTGRIDHDSYQKDNETNWINYDHIRFNKSLLDYYRGLIRMRKNIAAFGHTEQDYLHFHAHGNGLHISFEIDGRGTQDPKNYLIALNGDPKHPLKLNLENENWQILVSEEEVFVEESPFWSDQSLMVSPTSGIVLARLR